MFGRSHFTVSYFGANIYPENVTVGLEQDPVAQWVTGKFTLESVEDADRDRYLALAVELAPGVAGTEEMRRVVAESVVSQLRRLNSEFAPLHARRAPDAARHAAADRRPGLFPAGREAPVHPRSRLKKAGTGRLSCR